jgi:hypothetical protein
MSGKVYSGDLYKTSRVHLDWKEYTILRILRWEIRANANAVVPSKVDQGILGRQSLG